MNGTILLIFTFIILFISIADGQPEDKSPTVQYLNKRGFSFQPRQQDTINGGINKWPDSLYYNTAYTARLLGSPTIPISFTRIEVINGQYNVTPTIGLGYGYTWFFGNFIFNENDKIEVDPTFFFGVIGDFGLQNNLSLQKFGSIFTGAFIGFASFSLFGGYDYIATSPIIGLGGRIDLYTIHQNSLNPIGKVREKRKHKSAAPPIQNE